MSHVHPNSRNRGLKILAFWAPVLVLPLIWILYPKCLSEKNPILDLCDTRWYDRFDSHVGYRIPVVAVVKMLKAIFPTMTSFQCGTLLSSVGLLGLFGLLRKYFRTWHGTDPSNLTLLLWSAMSPSILLLAAQISTDFLSGLLCMWVLMELEWERVNQRLAQVGFWKLLRWAFVLVLSFSVKETIIFLWAGYGLVFLIHELKTFGKVAFFLVKLVGLCIGFIGLEMLVDQLIYGNFLHKYEWIILKPHGGNGEGEIAGATQSAFIHYGLFHVENHLKLYGRMGIAGMLGLVAAVVYLRRNVWAQTLLAVMVIMTAMAFTARFLMERYFLIVIVIELALMGQLLMAALKRWPGMLTKLAVAGVAIAAVGVSLFNFTYRYNPPLIKRNPQLETDYCCQPELCPNDPFFWPEADEAKHEIEQR
jgi:hypothetical protein